VLASAPPKEADNGPAGADSQQAPAQ
jgi:hypothetical protein